MSRSLDGRLAKLEAACERRELRRDIARTLAEESYHPSLTVERVLAEMRRLATLPLAEWRAYYATIMTGSAP
jgi:hypothetical protein